MDQATLEHHQHVPATEFGNISAPTNPAEPTEPAFGDLEFAILQSALMIARDRQIQKMVVL